MRHPGVRLRAIVRGFCDAQTMERLVDPTLADLQAEYGKAVECGLTWQSRWIWIRGHIALIRVIAVHGGLRGMGMLHDWTDEDRRALLGTLRASVAIMIVASILLTAGPFLDFISRRDTDSAYQALYLVPQVLPLSIPVGLTFGILWGLGRAPASRRSRTRIMFLAMAASVASFTMLAWVIPMSNQAFRVSIAGRPVDRGANELTLGELRQMLEPGRRPQGVAVPVDVRVLTLNYHGRWALASAPLVLALFAVALASQRRWGPLMLLLAGCLVILGYYIAMVTARKLGLDHTLPALTAAWTPNLAFLIVGVAVWKLSSTRAIGVSRV